MIIFAGIAIVHIIIFGMLTRVWNGINTFRPSVDAHYRMSVILPVRNEESHILPLLGDLEEQDYPYDLFEVIVIDDHSTDQTRALLNEYQANSPLDLKVYTLTDKIGKKAAATVGVEHASGEIILCTDGDCRVPPTWINTYGAFFQKYQPQMVSGPVKMLGDRFFDIYQALDFSSLIAFGAATLQKGYASTCNGANMAYLKNAFDSVNGYEGNDTVPSGDDEFLLQKVFERFPGQVHFMKSKDVLVCTYPKATIGGFIQQRLRWLSKWRLRSNWWLKVASVYAFVDFVSIFIMVYGVVVSWWSWSPIILLITLRWLAEAHYLQATSRFLGITHSRLYFPIVSFVYPFYVLLLGFGSIFGKYSWKGRSYS